MSMESGNDMRSAANRILAPLAFFVAFIAVWETLVQVLSVPRYLVPAPSDILEVITNKFYELSYDALVTLSEAFLGFLLGTTSAFLLGSLFVFSRLLERSVAPLFVAFQAVPLIAISPLLIIWFGNGMASKVVMAAIACFFPMVINTAAGLKAVPSSALDLMKMLSASRMQVFWKLRLPMALPYLFTGLKISATLSVIGAVVAELAGATKGIGFRVLISSYQTDTPMLFAAIIFSAFTGILFFQTVAFAEARIMQHSRWGK